MKNTISFQDNVAMGVTDEMVFEEVVVGIYMHMLSKDTSAAVFNYYCKSIRPGTVSWAVDRFLEYYGENKDGHSNKEYI
jgi:hypothetical protein